MYWAVRHSDGSVTYHVTNGNEPSAEGIDTGSEYADTRTERQPHQSWDFATKAWVDDVASKAAETLLVIERERKAEASLIITTDAGKATVYAHKSAERDRWSALSDTERRSLSDDALRASFPMLWHDAQQHGDTMADAHKRISAGVARSIDMLAELEAKYQAQKAELKKLI